MGDFIALFLKSKRNVVALGTLIPLVYQAVTALQSGQPIPEAVVIGIGAIVSTWILGDSVRPTMPKTKE
jgi:hypothetical protein